MDDGFLSLYDADTYDNREDLNIPVFTEIASEIRAAIENDKAILVRKINERISSHSMMNSKYCVLREYNLINLSLIYSAPF